jgi:hypothetical protein
LYFLASAADNLISAFIASLVGFTFSKFQINAIPILGLLFRFA